MPSNNRGSAAVERVLAAVLFVWLVWLPLPFGSNVEAARRPLIAVPLALCAAAASMRLFATRYRAKPPEISRAWQLWSLGAVALIGIAIVQLVPLPHALLGTISPASEAIWRASTQVAALAGAGTSSMHPITIDPQATAFELFRLLALLAAFQTSAIVIRNHSRRIVLAYAVAVSAMFQAMYGVREAAIGRHAIWGWVNTLIFDRVTGTFVNPNHFAHYAAISLPMALFICASAWRDAAPPRAPIKTRLVQLFERRFVPFAFGAVGALACVAAILVAQSRGALLALGGGLLMTAALLPGRRAAKLSIAIVTGLIVVGALIFFLGQERTTRRFEEADAQSALTGRRISALAAIETWKRFPLLGSGLGTFERVVSTVQREGGDKTYHHAHDDYLEIAATGGTFAFVAALGALAAGTAWLVRQTTGAEARALRWKRRAFQWAALASLAIALVHAFIDFNFFIPSNPATLAVILGAAVTVTDRDLRERVSPTRSDAPSDSE